MSKQVLVVIPVEERHKEYLENIGTGCVFTYTSPKAVTEEELANAQIIIGNVSAEQLAKAPKLEWFQLNSAGSDAFCKPGVLKEGVLLTNATGAYGLAISEHMLGVTLMMQKHLAEYYVNQKNHQWKDEGTVTSISSSSTGDTTVSYPVVVTLSGDVSKVYDGMSSEVTFVSKEVKDVTYVSNKAITTEGTKSYVTLKKADGTTKKTKVVTGFSDGHNVEIKSGLKKGDTVLIESQVSQ